MLRSRTVSYVCAQWGTKNDVHAGQTIASLICKESSGAHTLASGLASIYMEGREGKAASGQQRLAPSCILGSLCSLAGGLLPAHLLRDRWPLQKQCPSPCPWQHHREGYPLRPKLTVVNAALLQPRCSRLCSTACQPCVDELSLAAHATLLMTTAGGAPHREGVKAASLQCRSVWLEQRWPPPCCEEV